MVYIVYAQCMFIGYGSILYCILVMYSLYIYMYINSLCYTIYTLYLLYSGDR